MRYCSSDFKVFGLEKSKCCVIVLVILRYLGLRKANVRSPVMRDFVPFLRFFTYHGIVTCVRTRVTL